MYAINRSNELPRKKHLSFRQKMKIREEDMKIVKTLEELQTEMEILYNSFDTLTEPVLVDSCVFQLQSLNMKYQYYLGLCKEREIIANI